MFVKASIVNINFLFSFGFITDVKKVPGKKMCIGQNMFKCVQVCVFCHTFRNSDVCAQVAIQQQSPEGHFLEANSLQLREALQRDRLQANATS